MKLEVMLRGERAVVDGFLKTVTPFEFWVEEVNDMAGDEIPMEDITTEEWKEINQQAEYVYAKDPPDGGLEAGDFERPVYDEDGNPL